MMLMNLSEICGPAHGLRQQECRLPIVPLADPARLAIRLALAAILDT